ncbi:MAG: ABC transporter ATP-binding protein [Planctomycetota bacterium]|nr:MAG: ABC transporter ATP-binding protein [Planctomycetota bacterium]
MNTLFKHTHLHGEVGPSPFGRLMALLRPEKSDIWSVVLYSIGVGALTLAVPVAVQLLVNTVAFGSLLQPLIVLTALLFFGLTISAALRAMQTYVLEIIQRRIFVRVVSRLAHRLPRVRVDVFDRTHGPELVNRFFDVLTVQKVGAQLLLDGLAILLQGTIGMLVLAFYHPILLAFDVVLLILLLIIIFVMGRRAIATSIDESYAKYQVAGWLEEMARHPLAFKLGGGPQYALERADLLAREYLTNRSRHFSILFRQTVGALALQAVASTALLGIGGWLVIEGRMTLGQLVAAELIVTLVVASFAKLGKHLESFYDLMAAVEKLGQLLDLPAERQGGDARTRAKGPARLLVDSLTFAYEGSPPAIRDFTLRIEPGERVGIVGPNGSGKSTLVELLFAMRTPTGGRIELDGVDLRDLRLDELRRTVAIVQGFEMFEGTILDNVRLGRDEITHERIREALAAVDLLDEVLRMPDALNTVLTTGGAPLSSGQARRLQIARAIVGEPALLVIDESLEDIEVRPRRKVLETLLDRSAPWTLLVASHGDDVLARMDRVVRMTRADEESDADDNRNPVDGKERRSHA